MTEVEKMEARLLEIIAALEGITAGTLGDKEVEQLNVLNDEATALTAKIEAVKKAAAITASASASTRKTGPASTSAKPNEVVVIGNKREDINFGFESAGHYVKAIKDSAYGNVDPRLNKFMNASQNEGSGEAGGFLVPADMRQEIQKKVMGDESLLPLTKQFKTNSNRVELPINEVAPWDSTGFQAYWEGEEVSHTESKTKFGLFDVKLNKLTALVKLTDEILSDTSLIESYVRQEAPNALVHKINSAIISGDGVGKPAGFLSSAFKIKVLKEGGQAVDTVLFENINKMFGQLLPSSVSKSFWLVNPAVLPQLRLMKFTDNSPVYIPGMGGVGSLASAPHGYLMGLPIRVQMAGVKALGDEGDISLVDLSYYHSLVKVSGFKSEINPWLYWDKDVQALKIQTRIGGGVPYKAPVTTEFGSFNMSAFITLEDR